MNIYYPTVIILNFLDVKLGPYPEKKVFKVRSKLFAARIKEEDRILKKIQEWRDE